MPALPKETTSKLSISVPPPPPPRCGGRYGGPPSPAKLFTEMDYLNVLQCMGQSVHMLSPEGYVIYWNRSAENLFGYSEAEAIGRSVFDLIILARDVGAAELLIEHGSTGQTWSGQFPVRHKMGHVITIVATNTTLYDDDGTVIGVISVSCDSRLFKDTKVSVPDAEASEMVQDISWRPGRVTTRVSQNHDPSLQTSIASKFTNLACKVGSKIRSKMKTGESYVFWESRSGDGRHFDNGSVLSNYRKDGNSNGSSTPEEDSAVTPFGVFTSFVTCKSPVHAQGHIDESKRNLSIHTTLIGNKAMQQSDRNTTEHQRCRFGLPRKQVSSHPHSEVKSEIQISDYIWPIANEDFRPVSLYDSNSPSTSSSCESICISPVQKLDVETDRLDYEVLWEDLTVGEQIGQGACGTVYHGLWHGSDVAIKVFSKQEYSEEVIFSFRQEVSLMKRLRHPNILLFMGAVTSPPRLCIITEFLPRGSLFTMLRKSTLKLDWRRRLHMAIDIARGMNYLHNCNPPIVHRDLKSSNLLVDKNWGVKVADFGLSRVKHETYLATKSGKGTPQWMAPEVIQNDRSDEKSDLYSFGVILWELATQKVPWEHLNPMQVIGAVGFMNERLDIPEDLDPRWSSLIESCWHSDPKRRPTFQDVLDKLKDMQRQNALDLKASRGAGAAAPGARNGNSEL